MTEPPETRPVSLAALLGDRWPRLPPPPPPPPLPASQSDARGEVGHRGEPGAAVAASVGAIVVGDVVAARRCRGEEEGRTSPAVSGDGAKTIGGGDRGGDGDRVFSGGSRGGGDNRR